MDRTYILTFLQLMGQLFLLGKFSNLLSIVPFIYIYLKINIYKKVRQLADLFLLMFCYNETYTYLT